MYCRASKGYIQAQRLIFPILYQTFCFKYFDGPIWIVYCLLQTKETLLAAIIPTIHNEIT